MSLSILVDMNLSVEWAELLTSSGWPAVHWSQVGDPGAADTVLMDWARTNNHVVFTNDLDFGTALALTNLSAPSVIQVRGPNVLPEHLGPTLLEALRRYEVELRSGALVVLMAGQTRVRILPFPDNSH